MKRRFPLHIHISTLFAILLLIVGSVIGGLGYTISRDILKSTSNVLSSRIGRETLREFTNLIGPVEMATRLLSLDDITAAKTLAQRLDNLGFICAALSKSSELTSLYIGYGNGDFFLVRRLWNDADRTLFKAPEETAFIVQSIEHGDGAPSGRYIFLDSALATLRIDEHPDYPTTYDPRSRDWYKAAMASAGQIKTPPYLFYTTQKVGTTIANRAAKTDAVVGADISLETLDRALARQKASPGSHMLLVNQQGIILAHEDHAKIISVSAEGRPKLATLADFGVPVIAQLAPIVKNANRETAQNRVLSVEGEQWHVSISPLQFEGTNPLFLISAIPDAELMASAYSLIHKLLIAMALAMSTTVLLTWLLARIISRPLRKLAAEADGIRHFEFSKPITVSSPVLEVSELALTMDRMKDTISHFLDISMAVAAENNFDRLMPYLLTETIAAAEAEAGVLFLADNDSLLPTTGIMSDGSALPSCSPVPDAASSSPLFKASLLARTAHSAPLTDADIDALGLSAAVNTSQTSHAIAVPLLNRQQNLVGAMLLLRKGETDDAQLSFLGALSGSAAVSLEAKALIRAQKLLFEAMIKLIAGAIDAKSAYTGGHCARVPELTKMLARAACEQNSGLYKDFSLDEDEWEALHVAAWLHDCGKVTTPEYVVDKATKLETLYDRIHEIRMRFEVLKRDAEIACLKAIVDGEAVDTVRARLAAELAQLDDDFAFVATCNEGGEFMAPEKQERLKSIAARTWLRTLDDRAGISHEEKQRKERTPAPELPIVEPLLADKPEHVFERQARDRIAEDNPWGFKMRVPELLYNKGELYNLGIARGTLAEEERYKINEHIVQTLIMLSQLPFPKHLRQVPEIAAGHHEKMDGTGYPKRLRGEDMSQLARMMAVADIFEALTAVDRPYKKGKTLSEAIKIMAKMRDEQHIDPDLFDLFLHSGVYREYAVRFLRPEQIDTVDIEAFKRDSEKP